MKLLRPVLGRLTQGVVFSCAQAEKYERRHVHGLVVTARCDIAQEKTPLLSYLPVVTLDHWLRVDGYELLHARATAEAIGTFKGALKSTHTSLTLLDIHDPRSIYNVLFAPDSAEPKYAKARKSALAAVERIETLGRSSPDLARELFEANPSLARGLISELATHRLSGFYFLPYLYDSGADSGYVVLLRQLTLLPRSVSTAIARGLDSAETTNMPPMAALSFAHETFAMPVAEIPSPDIEHILQCFSMLYGRIGVADLPRAYLDTLASRIPEEAST